MDDDGGCFGFLFGIAILLGIVWLIGSYVLPGLYWAVASLSYGFTSSLGWLTSESITPDRPEVMWGAWGGLLGASLAFWPLAPVYGWRKHRNALVWAVLGLMVLVAVCVTVFGRL